jgi:hypothetical protein
MDSLVKMDLTDWNSRAQIQGRLCFNAVLEKAVQNTKINLNRTNFNGTRQHFA